jgi:type IV secretory pathway VirB3-like protein
MDPIFRGCTRPALVAGIPLVPLVAILAPISLATVWISIWLGIYAWIWVLTFTAPLLLSLRFITAIDDQRLLQYLQLVRLLALRQGALALAVRRYSTFPR